MSVSALAYETYRASQGQEWIMRIGDPRTPPILFVPPLFEELNRLRALIAAAMRRLAAEGHGCWLPDLTGTGESVVALEQVEWDWWRQDVAAAAAHVAEASGRAPVIAAIRGGALIDGEADGCCWWRFAPVTGASLARDLDRASLAGGAEWAGYPASADVRAALAAAEAGEVAPLRNVRLGSDAGAADVKVSGAALWRRSEPGNSEELAGALAADLVAWSRACAVS